MKRRYDCTEQGRKKRKKNDMFLSYWLAVDALGPSRYLRFPPCIMICFNGFTVLGRCNFSKTSCATINLYFFGE
jgi:hypothetical protein